MLLNADRVQTNMLAQKGGGRLRLFYLDHEQSPGWRNDPDVSANDKVKAPAKEFGCLCAC